MQHLHSCGKGRGGSPASPLQVVVIGVLVREADGGAQDVVRDVEGIHKGHSLSVIQSVNNTFPAIRADQMCLKNQDQHPPSHATLIVTVSTTFNIQKNRIETWRHLCSHLRPQSLQQAPNCLHLLGRHIVIIAEQDVSLDALQRKHLRHHLCAVVPALSDPTSDQG